MEEMSYGQGHLHFRLNYAEELGIKKELKRFLKPSQRTVNQNTMKFRSNSPLSLLQDPTLSQFNQLNSVSRPRSRVTSRLSQPTCQSPAEAYVSEDSFCENTEKEYHISGKLSKSAMVFSRDSSSKSKDLGQLQNDHSAVHEHLVETDQRLKRPAISSMFGTIKPISIFSRPKPPMKLRYNLRQDCSKPRTSVKPAIAQKRVKQISRVTQAPFTKLSRAFDERSTDESGDSSCSSSSDSPDSDASNVRTSRKKKKKQSLGKTPVIFVPDKENDDVGTKNTPQLTDELPKIAGTSPIPTNNGLIKNQKMTQGISAFLPGVLPVKATARSVDEIIASLWSPQTQATSDLMIKQLMESVLGLNYITSENIEEKYEPYVTEIEHPKQEDGRLSSTQQQSSLLSNSLTNDKKSVETFCFMDMDEEQSFQKASSSIPEEDVTLLPEKEMTEEEAKRVLKSAAQISISDIIHVKGDRVQLTRPEATKAYPPVALLATWKPKTKSSVHQIIHHLCTVFPSNVLPGSLQLASRVLHTVDRKGHSVNLDLDTLPKKDKIVQASTKDKMGILQNGIQTSTLPSQNQKAGVVTLPPYSSNDLEEWQRIAEYYVEGPHMELIGEQTYLNSGTLKMFWAPAPPKFSAPLFYAQETLFSKYESYLNEQQETEEFLMSEAEESSEEDLVDPEHLALLVRVLSRRYNSLPNISFSSSSASVLKFPEEEHISMLPS